MASHQPILRATPHVRERKAPATKPAPLTTEQKKEKQTAREEIKAAINAEVEQWVGNTTAKANELAERFNKKPRYFLDLFFNGGVKLVRSRATNPWNAFMSKKADEVNDGTLYLSDY